MIKGPYYYAMASNIAYFTQRRIFPVIVSNVPISLLPKGVCIVKINQETKTPAHGLQHTMKTTLNHVRWWQKIKARNLLSLLWKQAFCWLLLIYQVVHTSRTHPLSPLKTNHTHRYIQTCGFSCMWPHTPRRYSDSNAVIYMEMKFSYSGDLIPKIVILGNSFISLVWTALCPVSPSPLGGVPCAHSLLPLLPPEGNTEVLKSGWSVFQS